MRTERSQPTQEAAGPPKSVRRASHAANRLHEEWCICRCLQVCSMFEMFWHGRAVMQAAGTEARQPRQGTAPILSLADQWL